MRPSLFLVTLALASSSLGYSQLAGRAVNFTPQPVPTAAIANVDRTSSRPLAVRPGDAPFELSQRELAAELTCVGGIANVKRAYLLVPGTGTNARQCYANGYRKLLGQLGFDVCEVSPPPSMMGDAQTSVEFVAFATMLLSNISGKKVVVQGWSQGNLLIQWMLTFFPSTRQLTDRYISLAGDFRGTTSVSGNLPAAASVRQQAAGRAQYLRNLAAKGGLQARVPTTSIFSETDQVIQPEGGPNDPSATSFLTGAGNIFLQSICPGLDVSHEGQLFLNVVFSVVKLALSAPNGFVSLQQAQAQLDPAQVCNLDGAEGLSDSDVASTQRAIVAAGSAIANPFFFVAREPSPRAYIQDFPTV